jgi:serine/threonine protein kinase
MENVSTHRIPEEPLSDLLLALEATGSSCDLALRSSAGAARLSVRGGKLADAEFGDQSGFEAVFSMLSLKDGEYELKPSQVEPKQSLSLSLSEVVKERLRSGSFAGSLVSGTNLVVTTALERTSAPLPRNLSPLALRLLAMVNGRLTALDIAAGEKSSPAETLTTLRSLVEQGLVRSLRAGTLALGTRLGIGEREPFGGGFNEGDDDEDLSEFPSVSHTPELVRDKVPPRLAGPSAEKPSDTGYSSVPPMALAEEKIKHPRSFRTPVPDKESRSQPKLRLEASGRARQGGLDDVLAVPDEGLELERSWGGRERRDSDLGPDPAVVKAAAGQLTDSEMPLPSSRLGRHAISQLDELNQAVASSRHPKLPKLDDQEMSQTFTAAPGSVPLPENLPGNSAENRMNSGLPVVGRYEILARLKRGGMGSVYMCRLSGNAGFRRLFAMKVLHGHLAEQDDALEAFFHEARVLGGLHHRNIVGIADVGSRTEPYIVLDYVEGGNLSELYRATPKERSPALIVRIVLDALSGLAAAHNATRETGEPMSLIHCDISPHNLLVGLDGTCRLTDFGIALTGQVDAAREVTRGKPGYLAPERLLRSGCDKRSDLFSIGVVLYSGLTGLEPFAGETAEATMRNILTKTPLAPSGVGLRPPPSLDWVCMRALARDPASRYQSAEEMAEELQRIAERENLLASHSDVAAWVEHSLAPTLAARRTASMRGTGSPESRYQPSTIPPPVDYRSLGSSSPPDAPSAIEHTQPLEPPASSNFDDHTEILPGEGGRALQQDSRRPLVLYIILALAMSALVWTVLRPDAVSSLLGREPPPETGVAPGAQPDRTDPALGDPSRSLEPGTPDRNEPSPAPAGDEEDRIVIPDISPAKDKR